LRRDTTGTSNLGERIGAGWQDQFKTEGDLISLEARKLSG
jgi:hypothetical protein